MRKFTQFFDTIYAAPKCGFFQMDTFGFFFVEGLKHISDITAYDHILFITALAGVYALRQWRLILLLVTAFTLGHSLALALSVYDIVRVPSALIEFCIPLSILATCALNIAKGSEIENLAQKNRRPSAWGAYFLAIVFGLIHGLGFSNYLRFILLETESLFTPLMGFNLGLEAGQLLIVGLVLFFNFLVVDVLGARLRDWILVVSAAVAGIALVLSIETGYAWWAGE